MREDLITYEILEDGTCSYCGSTADMIYLPDGEVALSDTCQHCESFNDEIRIERMEEDDDY